ncbi:MAG: 30S ribosomal protein S12 methylthiotransferase RimO [Ignavibacteria bacterium]
MKVKKDKVKIITLGCSKNLVDSEHISAQLKNGNVEIVEDENKANTVIINTCGFIQPAKEESINTILAAVENKQQGKLKNVYVAGCLSDRYMEELIIEIPEVDKYFGATSKPKTMYDILNAMGIDYKKNLVGERSLSTKHYAYLKISDGCDNPCSFCAIPIMRGGHVSKPLKEIINEAKKLADKGIKELLVIGQDTTYWGMDINRKREIAKVLNALSDINGIEWIRLMYAYPSRFPDGLIEVIANNEKVCKYIDIPIQHISDNMLKIMRRGITKKQQIHLLESLRNKVEDIAIRTTLLVGHPGETEEDVQELADFVRDFEFDRLGVFTYSHEEGTYAHTYKDDASQREKNKRHKKILDVQKKVSEKKNRGMLNRVCRVIIDRKEFDYYIGRTYKDAPEIDQEVYIKSEKKLIDGNFYDAKIYDYEEFDLFGEIIHN